MEETAKPEIKPEISKFERFIEKNSPVFIVIAIICSALWWNMQTFKKAGQIEQQAEYTLTQFEIEFNNFMQGRQAQLELDKQEFQRYLEAQSKVPVDSES